MIAETGRARARWLGLGFLGVLALTLLVVLTRPSDSPVAVWWPASPLAAVLVMVMPPRWRVAAAVTVAVAVAVGNGVTGRGWSLAVAFGLGNGLEALCVGWLLGRRGRQPSLRTASDLGHLLGAALAGAVVIAVTVGPAAWWLIGDDPIDVGRSVFASHGSALLLLLPFALSTSRARGEGGRLERGIQTAALLALTLATFGPDQAMPMSLVPLAALTWSALRFSIRYLLVQNTVVAVAVTATTLRGWGPYATEALRSDDPLVAVNLVQLFSLIITSVVLAVAVLTEERRAALLEVERLSTHDELTSAGNRRLLEDRAEQAAHLAARGTPCTLLMLDLDGFKAVNDVDGHRVGDRVLIAVADRLRALLRPTDTLARLGGDEFVLLIADLDPASEACDRLGERVRQALSQPYEQTSQTIGVSVGRALLHPGVMLDALLHEADREMYADKHRRTGGTSQRPHRYLPRSGEAPASLSNST